MSRLLTGMLILAITGASLSVPIRETSAADEIGGGAASRSEFNGDGYADLAVGSMYGYGEAVSVIYGSASGLSAIGNQVWSQDSPGVLGVSAADEGFGTALATGDFDGDGFGDLAVGVPRDGENAAYGGVINVLYGSAAGLTAAGNQLWHQNSPDIAGTAEVGDQFGSALAAANFGDSAHDDLLVGTPQETVGHAEEAGAVQILYGSPDGLSATGNRMWTQHSPGIASRAETKDYFGLSVAAGDVDGDGYSDAAVGTPLESLGSQTEAGVVHVLYGSASGLTSSGSQLWSQDSPGVPGTAEFSDSFGTALAFADFDGDDHDDLAVGVPFESVGRRHGGAVNIIYGSASGLNAAGSQFWSQNSPGIIGSVEEYDSFGQSLAAADLGNGASADLVVGSPDEEVGRGGGGAINVLYGSPRGLSSARNQFWSSASPGIKGTPADSGAFGAGLAVGAFHGHASAELALGAPGEAETEGVGALHVITGSATGLTADGDRLLTPNSLNADVGPYFAATLAAAP